MNALDALLTPALARQTPHKPCVIGRLIQELPATYADTLRTLVMTPAKQGGSSADEVAARIAAAGLNGSATAVTRHRNGTCSCPTEGETK